MPTAHEFAVAAEALVGSRWRRHGRDPRRGIDCGGLLRCALRAIGVEIADSTTHDAGFPPPELLWRLCRAGGDEQHADDCGEGRVGLCSWDTGGPAHHLVVMLDRRRIVHVDAQHRRTLVIPAAWMEQRLAAVFRVRALTYGKPWQV